MVTEFFDDIIFRKEDVLEEYRFLPGDCEDILFKFDEEVVVYAVRLGRNPMEEGK